MLRERILQLLEKRDDIDQRKLARIAGLSESSISRFLHGDEEANFESVLKLVKYLFLEEEVEVMVEHIMTQKSRNARLGLEYCVMNHCWDQVDGLVEILSNSTNPLDKEWAGMYDLIRMRREELLPSFELLQKVEMFKPKEIEMQVQKTILKGYLYFDMSEYHSLTLHIDGIELLINEIQSSFLKESFYVRLSLIMNTVYLYANNPEKARHYSFSVIGQDYFPHFKTLAYNNLGNSYIFEDFEKSEKNFLKALDFALTFNQEPYVKIIKQNLSFLYSCWSLERDFTDEIENQRSLLNYIFYLIKKGDLSLAQEHMSAIEREKLPMWDQAFYYYYNGLLTDNIPTYYQSVELFVEMGNYFYLQLPLLELHRLGENENALKIISSKRGNLYEKANKNFTRK